jgi:hypothetical protein
MLAFVLLGLSRFGVGQDSPRKDAWVVLPIEEYKALRAKGNPEGREPQPPPLAATLTRLDYDLRVGSDSATGEARLTVDVLRDGWNKMPVPSGLLVREARVDGRPISLVEAHDGAGKASAASAPYLLFSKPGRSIVTLDIATPLGSAAGQEMVTLPSSRAALTRATISIPREGLEVFATGGLVDEKTEGQGGTRVIAHGRSGQALQISWRSTTPTRRPDLPTRLRGSLTEVAGLGEDGWQVSTEVQVEVVQGAAQNVRVALPEGLAVNQVSGGLVADWDVRPGALSVTFLEPLEHTTTFVVAGEAKAPREGQVQVPLLRLAEAERETGGVAVDVLGEGEMKGREAVGMQEADPTDLGGAVASRDSPSLAAFRYHVLAGRDPRSLGLTVTRYAAEAVTPINADEARYRVLVAEEGKILVQATWAVRNNQRAFLSVSLPAGADLWSAAVAGRPVRPGQTAEGIFLLPLEKGRPGDDPSPFSVQVVYLQRGDAWSERGEARIALPVLDVDVSRTGLEVRYSPRYRVDPKGDSFRPGALEAPSPAALAPPAAPPPAPVGSKDNDLRALVDSFQKEDRGRRVAGLVPLSIPFPDFGSGLFLVSELTAHGTAPVLDVAYRREGRNP